MRTCHNCESPVHPSWDFCPRCHSDLAVPGAIDTIDVTDDDLDDVLFDDADLDEVEAIEHPRTDNDDDAIEVIPPPRPPVRLSPAVHAAAWTPSLADRARTRLQSLGAFAREDGRLERFREATVPAWSLLLAFGVFALAIALVYGDGGNDDALIAAQQAQQDAAAQVNTLSAELASLRTSDADLRQQLAAAQEELTALQGDAAGSQTQLGALQDEVESLRAASEQAEADIQERDATIEEQVASIAALTECLGGMEIAIQFGRQDLWDPAERALQAVAGACADSNIFL